LFISSGGALERFFGASYILLKYLLSRGRGKEARGGKMIGAIATRLLPDLLHLSPKKYAVFHIQLHDATAFGNEELAAC
jgi:hypothetical protein